MNNIIFYTNILLIIVIFFNTILLSYITLEDFAMPQKLNTKLRSCTIYLTDEQDLCDKLEKIYKMSNIQLQIAFNKMNKQRDKKESALLLKYILEIKNSFNNKNLSCKIQFSQLKEVVSDNYLNITKAINYNDANLYGYCLAKISDNNPNSTNVNITDINTNTTELYEPIKISFYENDTLKNIDENKKKTNENIDRVLYNLLNNSTSICSYEKHNIDNGLKFLKLYCRLNKEKLICYKIDVLIYQNGNFVIQNNYNMNDFFRFYYNNRQVLYTPKDISVSVYCFIFDICKKIDEFLINNFIDFSFKDFYIEPKIAIYNIKLTSSIVITEKTNIYSIINTRINEIFKDIEIYNNQIKEYNTNIENNIKEYNISKENCDKLIDEQEKIICNQNLESNLISRISIDEEKKFLINKIQKLREEYILLVEGQQKLRNIGTTITEINDFIKLGIVLDYDKYSDLLSNDDCIYIQFS
jgi:hypothetical protein